MTENAAPTAVAGLRADGVRFDGNDAALLRAVAASGSVSGAAGQLGRSRARATTRLEELAAVFGPLVERRRGGPEGGGSRLTDAGERLLARFDRLRATLAGTAAAEESVLAGEVTAVVGETVRVTTGAGTVSAVLAVPTDGFPTSDQSATSDESVSSDDSASGDEQTGTDSTGPSDTNDATPVAVGRRVDVTIRADAVTVQTPDATPHPDATSARNRFTGTVEQVTRGDALVETSVAVGDETVRATVTADSADRLELAPDREVVVSFKATATRAVPRPHADE